MVVPGSNESSVQASLSQAVREAAHASRGLPPVHLWNPPVCGEIDIRICRDGRWLHEGGRIARDALVSLFSTVLRRDPDGFYLVTPAEKLRITVEDAPFAAVRLDRTPEGVWFETNVGDRVLAGPDHPLRVAVDAATGEPHPYVHVRAALEARLTRAVFYDLVEAAEPYETGSGVELRVWSGGCWFTLGATEPAPGAFAPA